MALTVINRAVHLAASIGLAALCLQACGGDKFHESSRTDAVLAVGDLVSSVPVDAVRGDTSDAGSDSGVAPFEVLDAGTYNDATAVCSYSFEQFCGAEPSYCEQHGGRYYGTHAECETGVTAVTCLWESCS